MAGVRHELDIIDDMRRWMDQPLQSSFDIRSQTLQAGYYRIVLAMCSENLFEFDTFSFRSVSDCMENYPSPELVAQLWHGEVISIGPQMHGIRPELHRNTHGLKCVYVALP